MERIVKGVNKFRSEVFPDQREMFEHLAAKHQTPSALFITCSDSRLHPNLITQTEPGDLFLLRNAGNIVPPYGSAFGGAGATIEYAIAVLNVDSIIICGHSHCGAMQALMHPEKMHDLPSVREWFTHADTTRRIVTEKYSHLSGNELVKVTVEENVLVQLTNLSTHPFVASRLAQGKINLYGWYYEIETGLVLEYNQETGWFEELLDEAHPAVPLSVRHARSSAKATAGRVGAVTD